MKRAHLLTVAGLILFAVLACWTIWWFFLASYAERLARSAGGEEARPRLEFATAARFGYPFTVGLELGDVRVTAPWAGGVARATTTRAVLSIRPWRPGDVMLDLPEGLGYAVMGASPQDRLTGAAARGSGAFVGEPAQTLTLDLDDVVARPATAAPVRAERGRIQWRAPFAAPQEVDIGFADIRMDETALFGPNARTAEASFLLHGPIPPTGAAAEIAAWRAGGGKVEVRRARVDWGALDLAATGTLGLDDAYRLAGGLRLELAEGVQAVKRIEGLGLLTPEAAAAAKALLAFASLGGGGKATAPLTFADGEAALAGVPVARLTPVCACR